MSDQVLTPEEAAKLEAEQAQQESTRKRTQRLLDERKLLKEQITAFLEENADVFAVYLEMVAAYNEKTVELNHLGKQMTEPTLRRLQLPSGVTLKRKGESFVNKAALLEVCGPHIFAQHPELVKGLSIVAMARQHPAVLRDSSLVEDVAIGALRELEKTGKVPDGTIKACLTTTSTYVLNGLDAFDHKG